MGDVVALTRESERLNGQARCLACKYEWQAVAQLGTIWLVCPECSLERGRYVAQIQRDGPHWVCNCGNDLYYVTPNGYYCPNCGAWAEGF